MKIIRKLGKRGKTWDATCRRGWDARPGVPTGGNYPLKKKVPSSARFWSRKLGVPRTELCPVKQTVVGVWGSWKKGFEKIFKRVQLQRNPYLQKEQSNLEERSQVFADGKKKSNTEHCSGRAEEIGTEKSQGTSTVELLLMRYWKVYAGRKQKFN